MKAAVPDVVKIVKGLEIPKGSSPTVLRLQRGWEEFKTARDAARQ